MSLYKRAAQEILMVMELFCILTEVKVVDIKYVIKLHRTTHTHKGI